MNTLFANNEIPGSDRQIRDSIEGGGKSTVEAKTLTEMQKKGTEAAKKGSEDMQKHVESRVEDKLARITKGTTERSADLSATDKRTAELKKETLAQRQARIKTQNYTMQGVTEVATGGIGLLLPTGDAEGEDPAKQKAGKAQKAIPDRVEVATAPVDQATKKAASAETAKLEEQGTQAKTAREELAKKTGVSEAQNGQLA